MSFIVSEESEDRLSCKSWVFDVKPSGGFLVSICLVYYTEMTRKTTRHKFKGPFWDRNNKRAYHSSLPRPQTIPDWVLREARRQIIERPIGVYIGWFNEGSFSKQIEPSA